jgi:hypothetical protein
VEIAHRRGVRLKEGSPGSTGRAEGRRGVSATAAPHVRDWLAAGGWHVASHGSCGLTAHRGVLHPDEYVDEWRVYKEAERRFGFKLAEVWEVYCQGRKSAAQLALRALIDARLLDIAEAGGNLTALARIFEVDTKTFGRALARARQVRKEAA